MKHDYETSATCGCDDPCCAVCVGGLDVCRVCGLYEGSLTTDCPGVPSYREHADRVYRGEEDFRGGAWVPEVTVHMAHAYPERYRP